MPTLKLGSLADQRPVKISIEVPASVVRDLQAYGALLAESNGETTPIEPARLIAPMIERFMASDRGFAKARRSRAQGRIGASE